MKKLQTITMSTLLMGLLFCFSAPDVFARGTGNVHRQNSPLLKADRSAIRAAKTKLRQDMKAFGKNSNEVITDRAQVRAAEEKLKSDLANKPQTNLQMEKGRNRNQHCKTKNHCTKKQRNSIS